MSLIAAISTPGARPVATSRSTVRPIRPNPLTAMRTGRLTLRSTGRPTSERHLLRHAALEGAGQGAIGHGEILQSHAGAVEQGDLVVGGPAGMTALDHLP